MTWQLALSLIKTGPTVAKDMKMLRQIAPLNLDPKTKTCRDCGIVMSVDFFSVASFRKDGSPCLRPNCDPCRRRQEAAQKRKKFQSKPPALKPKP